MNLDVSKKENTKDIYKFSRLMYIIEAALEYFISIAVGTIYLAKLTSYIGMSDTLTGILSSFVSLGCGFQLFAIFFASKRSVKSYVTFFHIISQVLFALLYFIPIFPFTITQKSVIFFGALLLAQVIHNAINSPKINWFMSLVDNTKRGRFTAKKEFVSLIGGIIFSYSLGTLMDFFEARGEIRTAFIIGGIGLSCLMILHSLTLILSKEKPPEKAAIKGKRKTIRVLAKNKNLWKVILIFALWNVANYMTSSFLGVYQTKELGFSTTFASVIIMCGSLARAALSYAFGRFADKFSFRRMLIVCLGIEALAFGLNIFTVPSNGAVFFFMYYVLFCVGMAGISSASINLLYDYVPVEQRVSAFALQQSCSGIAGFLATLAVSPLVSRIQKNGNSLFGISIYAQQLLSLLSCAVVCFIILYLIFVMRRVKRL